MLNKSFFSSKRPLIYITKCKQQYDIDISEKVQIYAEGLPSFEKKTRFVLIKLFHEYWINSYSFKKQQKNVISDRFMRLLQVYETL